MIYGWTTVKPRLCDCLFCVSLILWSGFLLLVCVCDFYWVVSCFLWMGFWFGFFIFIFIFTRILKFQRVAHNVFDKLLVWLCMIKLTWVCAASHCVVVFFFFFFNMSLWRNLMIETKQWVVGSYSTSWKIFIWLDCALLYIINDILNTTWDAVAYSHVSFYICLTL